LISSKPALRSNFFTKIPSSPQQLAAHFITRFKASASTSGDDDEANIPNK
jgi:hypothetical protein